MSKQLAKAVSEGKVVVRNKTAGEVILPIVVTAKDRKTVLVPPFGEAELAPKHLPVNLIDRVPTLKSLLAKGILRVL